MKLIIFQAGKHLLVGIFATIIDIYVFLILTPPCFPLFSKTVSFIVSMAIKYIGNKYWVFKKTEKEGIKKELVLFLLIMSVGTLIDVVSFHFFSSYYGIQVIISVILATIVAAMWNFIGCKFIVFQK